MCVTKNVNNFLSERLINMERQFWANVQCSRRECVEITGIPSAINDSDLDVVCRIK